MSASTILTSKRGFVRSSAFLAATLALAAALPMASSAATPIALWDGANTDLGNFSLTVQNGNTIENNVITIASGATGGVVYTGADSSLNNCTFIIRCSGLDFANANNQYLLSLHQNILGGGNGDASYNKVGVSLAANNAAVRGIWENAFYGNNNMQVADPFSSGTDIVINIQTSGGVFVYEIVTDAGTGARTLVKRYGHTGLKASNTNYKGFSLGGIYEKASSTLSPATGWTISQMAVFGSTLSEAEILGYAFPSDIDTIAVNDNTTVSALNTLIAASSGSKIILSVADGVEIDVDTAFVASVPVEVASSGSITLSANAQPDASYFSAVSFAVEGALFRSWLTPGVVGFNFYNNKGGNTSGALAAGTWCSDADSANGTSTAMFADGLSALTWASKELWSAGTGSILSGYLDDGAKNGHGAEVYLSNVPYATYDVIIYCNSDSGNGNFHAKTVNGTTYTWDSSTSAVVAGSAAWGKSNLSIPVYGVNALRIKNLTGPLSIYGGERASGSGTRGGIAAIQIMPPNTPDNINYYKLTLSGTATTWSAGTWTLNGQTVDAPVSGYVEIVASASTTLTVDQAVNLADLKVRGDTNIVVNVATNDTGSLFAIKATVAGGVFQQGSPAVLGAATTIVVEDGATFDLNGQIVDGVNLFKLAGAGAGNWPWALTSSGGEFPLGTLREISLNGNTTIGGANRIRFGISGYSSHIAYNNFTLTKTGAGEFLLCNGRSATGSVGTLEVAEGEVTFTDFTCIDGYEDVYAHTAVIVREGATIRNNTNRFIWMDSLNWLGGEVISTNPFAITNTFEGAGTTAKLRFASGAQVTLTGDLVITNSLELGSYGQNAGDLSLVKAEGLNSVTGTVSGTFTSAGSVSVGAGVTLNIGKNRPTATFNVDDDATLAVQLQSNTDVVSLSVNAQQPANLVVYDADGVPLDNARVTYSDGVLTIMAHLPTLPAVGTVSFDTPERWEDSLMPSANGDAIIELSGDARITVDGTYQIGTLMIFGAGTATFAGDGSVTAVNISLKNGAALTRNSKISATTGIALDSGTVLKLDGVTESAAISGAGAVETYGAVTFNENNTFTGGLTVKSGSEARTIKTGIGGQAYGKNNFGEAIANLSRIVVEDGGSLDLANTVDACYAITISGKGVYDAQSGVYKGALYNSGSEIGWGSRQTASLTLAADAMVKAESSNNGWGIVNSSHAASVLALNGHTLTVSGAGYFPIVNANTASGTTTTGTLVADGVTLGLVGDADKACNLTGVNVIAKGCATINLATAPSAIGSLTLKPSASGTTASSWNLPSGCVPTLDTSNVDPSGLTVGQELTLFTAPSATELTAETIAVKAGGRYTTSISVNIVTATVKALANFMHYDFNAANSIATDSTYNFGNLNPTFVNGKNGSAGKFVSGTTPWFESNTANKSPFYAGEMTVTSLLKVKEANNTIIWNFGSGYTDGIALIAKDSSTMAVVSWAGQLYPTGGNGSDVVSVTDIADLMNKWHLVTIVANANGTTLYVDGTSATVGTVLPGGINGQGQFGSIHGTAKNYNAVSGDGFLLDDWRVYDAALTAKEIKALKRELNPDPLFIRLR